MAVLITGIGELTTNTGAPLATAALVIDGERVAWVGQAADAPEADERVDVEGRAVLPGWVDSHTHLVFAGDRTAEFDARMAGQAYSAGGIAITVEATRAASDEELAAGLRRHVAEAVAQGTTCMETKTGYGLTVEDERRAAIGGVAGRRGHFPRRTPGPTRLGRRRLRGLGVRRHARRARPARPLGRRLLRDRRVRRGPVTRGAHCRR